MHAASPLLSTAMRSFSVIASFFVTASLREPMLVTVNRLSASSYMQMQPKSMGRSDSRLRITTWKMLRRS